MRKLAIILFLAVAAQAQGALTLVAREDYQTVGTYTSGSFGSAFSGMTTGTIYKEAVGPRTSGIAAPGWSAAMRATDTGAYFDTSATPTGFKMIGGWVRFSDFGTAANLGHSAAIFQMLNTNSSVIAGVGIKATGQLFGIQGSATAGATLSKDTWYYIAFAWSYPSTDSNMSYQVWYKTVGGTLTKTIDQAAYFTAGGGSRDPKKILIANIGVGSTYHWLGRIGATGLYTMASYSDVGVDSAIVDPVEQPTTWYVNAATGSDTNTGLSSGTAWQTITRLNSALTNGVVLTSSGGFSLGDTVVVDGSTTPLDLGTTSLTINARAVKLSLLGTEPIKAWATIGGTWSLSATTTNVYETTDSAATDLTGVVVWEDDKWLAHVNGANFAAVKATLDSTAGSFYSDGTKVYVHPFGNTNPTSDGKVYTRSRYRTTTAPGDSAVLVQALNVWIDGNGGVIKKTTLCNPTNGDPYVAYGVQWNVGGGGTNMISNFGVDYFSKHGFGRTTSASDMSLARVNCTYGQGSIYAGIGGQTQDVDYCAAGTGNSWSYTNCASIVNYGVIGSAAGTVQSAEDSWTSHGGASTFSSGTISNSAFCSGLTEQGVTTGTVTVTNSTIGGALFACNATLDRITSTLNPVTVQSSKTLSLTNFIFRDFITITNVYWSQLQGTATIKGGTIDLRGNGSSSSARAIWSRLGASTVTIQNVAILSDNQVHVLLDSFVNTDTLSLSNNYYGTGGTTVVNRYNDGSTTANRTFAQWQALGFDASSNNGTAASVSLDAIYKPLRGSPVINAGVDLGPLVDYTNRLFAVRNDIGAYEFIPANQSLVRRGGLRR